MSFDKIGDLPFCMVIKIVCTLTIHPAYLLDLRIIQQTNNTMRKRLLFMFFAIVPLFLPLQGCLLSTGQKTSNKKTTNSTSKPKAIATTRKRPSIAKPMTMLHRVIAKDERLHVFLQLNIPRLRNASNLIEMLQDVSLKYGVLPNYRSKEFIETQTLKLTPETITKQGADFYYNFSIPKKTMPSAVMLIEANDSKTGQRITLDVPLEFVVNKIRQSFSIFDAQGKQPLFRNYFLNKASIQIKDLAGTNKTLLIKHYKHNFKAARPPMSLSRRNIKKKMEVDSTFKVQTNTQLNLKKPGLYIVQADTNQYYGISFIVAEHRYPKFSKIVDLIDPLTYITTKGELNKLKQSSEKKKDLDRLWLELMSGNIKVAKRSIREYYRRVKLANKFFTTYKPGWKTDKGMVFIVFGNPTRVVRTRNKEMWTYAQSASFSDIHFTFLRNPNQFVDNHYTLVRYPEYEQVWYPKIEQWREGKIGS
ncbi:hypothetical protein M23134_03220 [Microscilla marina ATCC 23134]|uniref:GWxTD domain-containing protein n=2 Tax=Microscilla marina TaxID=1027 RepID=A1ZGG5_MICM2|nr:hypothetical protein M23134_03220 [Microscilla marina ATCC 23134]